jgi:GntR family histidine utilization transcriptional repressor
MTTPTFRNWQDVKNEVLRRIHAREWKPGDLIPNEVDLALEFGCARTTVNRALRDLATAGLLDRRRKAGTRIAAQPVAKATVEISVIRTEIEDQNKSYNYQLISRCLIEPPTEVSSAFKTAPNKPLLHVTALHLADGTPYAFEDRWIDPAIAPGILEESFEDISANEWLLEFTPYTRGQIVFAAVSATKEYATVLQCPEQSALFTIERMTWDGDKAITKVRLLFRRGHQICSAL